MCPSQLCRRVPCRSRAKGDAALWIAGEKQPAFHCFSFLWVAGEEERAPGPSFLDPAQKQSFLPDGRYEHPRHILLIVNNTPEYVHGRETRVQNPASSVRSSSPFVPSLLKYSVYLRMVKAKNQGAREQSSTCFFFSDVEKINIFFLPKTFFANGEVESKNFLLELWKS